MRTMIRLMSVVNRLRALVLGRRIERDLDEEMAFHLDAKVRELVAEGVPEAEARSAARRAFGNLTLASEDSRAAWRYTFFDSILQDVRYGARALRRTPVFTVAVTLTLALGIGANTAIFTLIDRVLLRSLAVQEPDALVTFGSRSPVGIRTSDGPPERDNNLFSVSAVPRFPALRRRVLRTGGCLQLPCHDLFGERCAGARAATRGG